MASGGRGWSRFGEAPVNSGPLAPVFGGEGAG